jgi:hypothetical protein
MDVLLSPRHYRVGLLEDVINHIRLVQLCQQLSLKVVLGVEDEVEHDSWFQSSVGRRRERRTGRTFRDHVDECTL